MAGPGFSPRVGDSGRCRSHSPVYRTIRSLRESYATDRSRSLSLGRLIGGVRLHRTRSRQLCIWLQANIRITRLLGMSIRKALRTEGGSSATLSQSGMSVSPMMSRVMSFAPEIATFAYLATQLCVLATFVPSYRRSPGTMLEDLPDGSVHPATSQTPRLSAISAMAISLPLPAVRCQCLWYL